MPAKSLELKHTIKLIQELTIEIEEIEAAIKRITDEESLSPILTIPDISYRMGAMIVAESGDFSRFDSADKLLYMPGCLPPLISQGSWITAIPIWKNVIPDTSDMGFTMLQSMSVTGINLLVHIFQRSAGKASITT